MDYFPCYTAVEVVVTVSFPRVTCRLGQSADYRWYDLEAFSCLVSILEEDCDCPLCQALISDLKVGAEILFLECDKLCEEPLTLPVAHANIDTGTSENASSGHEPVLRND